MYQVAVQKTPNPNLHDGRLRVAVAWREAKRYIQKPDLVIHVFSSLGTTRGSTGSTSAWVRLWFIVVILLLRRMLLVPSAVTNLPFPARL